MYGNYWIEIMVSVEKIEPSLVEGLYQTIMDMGFNFKGGFRNSAGRDLDVLAKETQAMLLDHRYWKDLLERQVVFESKQIREMRGIWNQFTSEVRLVLLICQDSLSEEDADWQIRQLKDLAAAVWERNRINAVQTHLAADDRGFNLTSIEQGRDILFRPFAIISRDAWLRYAPGYFGNCNVAALKRDGMMVSEKGSGWMEPAKIRPQPLFNQEYFAKAVVEEFPELRVMLEEHYDDYGELLGHIFFADAVGRPLEILLHCNQDMDEIMKYVKFVENMYEHGDDPVRNIVEVTILEGLIGEEDLSKVIKQYFSGGLVEAFRMVQRSWVII